MNRRKPEVIQQRPSLRRLLHNAHLRVALLAMGLTSLSLTLVSLLALSTYASHNLQLIARSLAPFSLQNMGQGSPRCARRVASRLRRSPHIHSQWASTARAPVTRLPAASSLHERAANRGRMH